jgi:hypothetical protein
MAAITMKTIQITRTIMPIMIRIFPIAPAGYGIGAYNNTAPITIRTIAKISKFIWEIAVIH